MALHFCCRDVGVDCDWTTSGKTQEEVIQNVERHAKEKHNMTQIPEDLKKRILLKLKEKKVA